MIDALRMLFGPAEAPSGAAADRIGRSVRAAHVLSVVLIALVALLTTVVAVDAVRERDRREAIEAKATLQRGLAHRIALLAGIVAAPGPQDDAASTLAALREAEQRMRAAHEALTGAGAPRGRQAPARETPALRAHYFEGPDPADAAVRRYLDAAARLAADPRRPGAAGLAAGLQAEVIGPLFQALQRAVDLHEAKAQEAAHRVLLLAFGQLGVMLLLLALQTALVFRPLLRGVSRMAARLEAEATTDPLTGLANRRAFLGRLPALRDAAAGREAALVLLDLRHLRDVNDLSGQAGGDAVLREAAARLSAAAQGLAPPGGPAALVGRLTGDDFAVAFAGPAGAAGLAAAAQRLREAVHATPFVLPGRSIAMEASAGAAPLGADPLEALRAADLALADARRDRAHPVRIFREELDARRLEVRRAILAALAAGDLRGLHAELQPQLALADGRLAGFEALARWTHPVLGPVRPGEFLDVAAAAGRLPAVGRAVRLDALALLAALRREGLPAPRVALNLSAGELADPAVLAELEADLAAAGLAPADIEIEVTEEVLADGIADASAARLAALQAAGASLALDDFGTGAASLSQLLRLPVQAIKIDRSFVAAPGDDPRGAALVQAMIRFGHAIGAKVVAEGVETEAQQAVLRAAGCDVVQGWLVAQPMAGAALRDWLRRAQAGMPA